MGVSISAYLDRVMRPWRVDGRRLLGEIDGCEDEAWVMLLSSSADDPRPVLTVQVIDGLVPGDGAGQSLAFIDPRRMADLLIEHGYCLPAGVDGV